MNEKVRMKIRKLLALAGSPNAAEARSAREMAEKLMKRHNISLGEIESSGRIMEKTVRRFSRVRQWQDVLLGAVVDYTAVEALWLPDGRGEKLILIGREDRVVQAENLYGYLYDRLISLGEDYRIVVKSLNSFRLGMARTVAEKLTELIKERTGGAVSCGSTEIVPAENDWDARKADQYIEDTYGTIGQRKVRESYDSNSLGLGEIVGRQVSLVEQLDRKS